MPPARLAKKKISRYIMNGRIRHAAPLVGVRNDMEQKRNILLRGTESFSRGEFDNVALENGAIVLDDVAGRHVLYGCYTGPELALPAFCSLNMSWNAITTHVMWLKNFMKVR